MVIKIKNKAFKIVSVNGIDYHIKQTGRGRFAKFSIPELDVKGYAQKRYTARVPGVDFVFYLVSDHKILSGPGEDFWDTLVDLLNQMAKKGYFIMNIILLAQLDYLDSLQMAGTDMKSAVPYLRIEYTTLTQKEAEDVFKIWKKVHLTRTRK